MWGRRALYALLLLCTLMGQLLDVGYLFHFLFFAVLSLPALGLAVSLPAMLGARAELLAEENPVTDLMSGIMKIHIFLTPPSPAQEIDFTLEYDIDYMTAAFAG